MKHLNMLVIGLLIKLHTIYLQNLVVKNKFVILLKLKNFLPNYTEVTKVLFDLSCPRIGKWLLYRNSKKKFKLK